MSSVADHLADYYTNAKVQRLPLTHQISPSGLFRGRALKCQLLTKVFDLISISMFCGLSQSHFRLRGSERMSGLSQIWNSFSVGTDRDKVRYPEHSYAGQFMPDQTVGAWPYAGWFRPEQAAGARPYAGWFQPE